MSEDRRAFSGRRTADPEVARRLGLGVGDDVVVMLFHGERHVGFVSVQGYCALIAAGVAGPSNERVDVRPPVRHPDHSGEVRFAFDELFKHEQE